MTRAVHLSFHHKAPQHDKSQSSLVDPELLCSHSLAKIQVKPQLPLISVSLSHLALPIGVHTGPLRF
ncbi:hypothetical protein KOW79_022358 [Hemibagrus wyckioides]|uniref:Uncharacterized protein n=1 Tax=Hemibagrus wyckioides TaxID=337641 RepID=A0A9D3N3S2_9TELE|nr:hypothetical protein KOW79_022358 [Hemibagrus wyckioides]